MSIVLVLGVNDIPYVQAPEPGRKPKKASKPGKAKPKRKRGAKGDNRGALATTGDVAEWLEDKYKVMETFAKVFEDQIAELIGDAYKGAIENAVATGEPMTETPLAEACVEIEGLFQTFIDQKMMDGLVPGVPTQASIIGIRSRFKSRRDPGRPSFQDSATYERNFACWTK